MVVKRVALWVLVIMLQSPAMAAAGTLGAGPLPETTFHELDGSPVVLSALRGKVLLINFWGTWCVPCIREIPELVRLADRFRSKGLEVVGIAVASGSSEDIREFMREHHMDYRVLIGEMSLIKRQFRVLGFPTSLVVDRHGIIKKCFIGPQTEEVLTHAIAPLLE